MMADPKQTGTDNPKEEHKKARNRTFKLVGGPHRDEDGDHEAGDSATCICKSSEDLVKLHGSDKFVEVDSSFRPIPVAGQPDVIPGVPPLTEAQMQAVADRVAANKAAKPTTAPK